MKTYTEDEWRTKQYHENRFSVRPFPCSVYVEFATTTNKNLSQKNVFPIELTNFRTPQPQQQQQKKHNTLPMINSQNKTTLSALLTTVRWSIFILVKWNRNSSSQQLVKFKYLHPKIHPTRMISELYALRTQIRLFYVYVMFTRDPKSAKFRITR